MIPRSMSSMTPMPLHPLENSAVITTTPGRQVLDVGHVRAEAGDLETLLNRAAEQEQPDHRLDQGDHDEPRAGAGAPAADGAVMLDRSWRARRSSPHLRRRRALRAERPAGVAQVDVVERRPGDGRPTATAHAGRSSAAEHRRHGGAPSSARARTPAAVDRATVAAGRPRAARSAAAAPRPRRVGQLDVDRVAAQLALQLVGGALGDDAAAVDDREPGRRAGRPPPGSGW